MCNFNIDVIYFRFMKGTQETKKMIKFYFKKYE